MRYGIVGMIGLVAMTAGITQAQVSNVFNMPAGQTSLQFVTVGDPGNAADTATGSLYGSVPYVYQMGKYDVTVGQYCQFLNAVAKTDPYGLYNSQMDTSPYPTLRIVQSGSSGTYSYSVTGGYAGSYSQAANCPVFDVSWGDAARFSNWLQNGQPTSGVENASTTENGAYTLNSATTNAALMSVTRNAGATYFIPSENEWYKAAYYDRNKPGGAGYWTYPTKSNTAPINILSSTGTNNANFFDAYGTGSGGYTDPTNYLTLVGAFAASPGSYGTYDMGGDVWQWNEANIASSSRGLRGGAWYNPDYYYYLAASNRGSYLPTSEYYYVGFRVASVPEPGSIAMLAGIAATALLHWRRRRGQKNSLSGFISHNPGDNSPTVLQRRCVMRRFIACLAGVAFSTTLVMGASQGYAAGRIVVANDDWTLSDQGFRPQDQPGLFARNVASWFTGGGTGTFLYYTNQTDLTWIDLANTMTSAGNSWTQDNFVPFDLPTLQGYDGVFLGWAPDENDVPHDNEVLVRYLNAGGNVYVFGAGNNDEDANHWNGFLNQFGLSFKTFGNEIDGDIPINSAHPIFVGVDHLFQMHGTSILDLQPSDPRNQVLVTYNGEGLYAVYDVPEPSVLVMLLAAALGWSIHVWRKRR